MFLFNLQNLFSWQACQSFHICVLCKCSVFERFRASLQGLHWQRTIQSDSLSTFPHCLFQPINNGSRNYHSSLLVSTHSNLVLSCGNKIPFSLNLLLSHEGSLPLTSLAMTINLKPGSAYHISFCSGQDYKILNVIHSSSPSHIINGCEF